MKSYTDLYQSKVLSKILSLESADMHYWRKGQILGVGHSKEMQEGFESKGIDYTPCWSLAALLDVLDFPSLTQNKEDEWEVCVPHHQSDGYIDMLASNPIDACVAMVEKLNELNLL